MTEYFVHATSLVDGSAEIGSGTKIWQFCNIMGDTNIGENCNIGQGVFVESEVMVGNRVKIKNNVALLHSSNGNLTAAPSAADL